MKKMKSRYVFEIPEELMDERAYIHVLNYEWVINLL